MDTIIIILILFCCSISLSASSGGAFFFGDDISDYIGKIIKPSTLTGTTLLGNTGGSLSTGGSTVS